MYLKLWFGTWLLACASHANAQLHSDNFRQRPAASLRDRKDSWFGNQIPANPGQGLDVGHAKKDLETIGNGVPRDHKVIHIHKEDTKDSFSGLPFMLRPRPASPSSVAMPKTLAPKSVGKQLADSGGDEDSSSTQGIGAFATLPPPGDRSKSRMRDRHRPREPLRDDSRHRLPSRQLPHRPNREFGEQSTRFFEDVTGHQQPFDIQPDVIHHFNTGSDRSGFNHQNAFLNPNRHIHEEPTVPASSNFRPSDRRHSIHIDTPSRGSQSPRISFFPDLGVTVDQPSRIQPENAFLSTTIRPTDFDRSNSFHNVDRRTNRFKNVNRGAASSVHRALPSRENQIQLHSTLHDANRNDRNWPSRTFNEDTSAFQGDTSTFHNSNPILPGSHWDPSGANTLDRPFGLNEKATPRTYSYGYSVNAPSTGDHKAAFEERDAEGTVKGQYSLLQPDGVYRLVSYEADAANGFRANVQYTPAQQ